MIRYGDEKGLEMLDRDNDSYEDSDKAVLPTSGSSSPVVRISGTTCSDCPSAVEDAVAKLGYEATLGPRKPRRAFRVSVDSISLSHADLICRLFLVYSCIPATNLSM